MFKKLFTICLILLLCTSVYATKIADADDSTAIAAVKVETVALLLLNADALAMVGAAGNVYYVDSGAGAGSGTGLDWANAKETLDAAVNLCSADSSDVILIQAGHAESWTTINAADFDRAGIKVIGCGYGESRPTFTYTTNGELVIGADDIEIYNLNFIAGNAVIHAIDVEAGFENFVIDNCRFWTTSVNTDEFIDCIDIAAGSDNGKITNCRVEMGAASAVSFISHVGSDYTEISGNIVFGDFSTACIEDATTLSIWMVIKDNILVNGTVNGTAGLGTVACISLHTDTSALIINNSIFCNVADQSLSIVADEGFLAGNTYCEGQGTDAGSQNISRAPGGRRHITLATTSSMTIGNGYDQDDDPAIFTVTGDILCRATATFATKITSTSTDTLNLGVIGAEACLLIQDVADGTAFDTGDTWTLGVAAETDGAQMADEWIVVSGGDIKLFIDDHGLTAGVATFYLEWIGLSANANVADVAP